MVLAECAPESEGGGRAAKSGAQVAIGAFVIPNGPIDPDTPLTAFAVPLDKLEAVAGMDSSPRSRCFFFHS